MFFEYGNEELNYLIKKDKKLAFVINKLGHINREINPDIFSSIVQHIIGQQISSKAFLTIWGKFKNKVENITPSSVLSTDIKDICSCGISNKKAQYIINIAQKINNNELDLKKLSSKSDDEVIKELKTLDGIGIWTAEMLMIFCLNRKNILSYGDYGILKGLKMLYHHEKIDKKLFEKYKKRFSPYCSIASFYIWAVANEKVEEIEDYN